MDRAPFYFDSEYITLQSRPSAQGAGSFKQDSFSYLNKRPTGNLILSKSVQSQVNGNSAG